MTAKQKKALQSFPTNVSFQFPKPLHCNSSPKPQKTNPLKVRLVGLPLHSLSFLILNSSPTDPAIAAHLGIAAPLPHSTTLDSYSLSKLHTESFRGGSKRLPVKMSGNDDELLPDQTEGFKVGEKKTIDQYHQMGMY